MTTYKFGVINEDELSLRSPRAIDGEECDTLAGAFAQATDLIRGGVEEVSIVRCRFSERHEVWVEVPDGSITIDARGVDWAADEDEDAEEEEEARACP